MCKYRFGVWVVKILFCVITEILQNNLWFFLKLCLTTGEGYGIIIQRVWENYARTAMMQEIASKDGNFCGVCPVIGRLSCSSAERISLGLG